MAGGAFDASGLAVAAERVNAAAALTRVTATRASSPVRNFLRNMVGVTSVAIRVTVAGNVPDADFAAASGRARAGTAACAACVSHASATALAGTTSPRRWSRSVSISR